MSEGVLASQLEALREGEYLRSVVSERTLEIVEQPSGPQGRTGVAGSSGVCSSPPTSSGSSSRSWSRRSISVGTSPGKFGLVSESLLFVVTLPAWVLIARMYGLYSQDDQRTNHVTTDEVANVFNMVTVCTWLFFAFSWLSGAAHPDVRKLLLFWAFAAVLVPLARTLGRGDRAHEAAATSRTRSSSGPAASARRSPRSCSATRSTASTSSASSTPSRSPATSWAIDVPLLGPVERLASLVRTFDVERVIIAFPRGSHDRILGA